MTVYRETGAPSGVVGARRAVNTVRWGAIWSGVVVASATMALLSSLWLALGFATGVSWIGDNISWWIGGTAVFSFFLAGFISGLVAGTRGIGAGLLNGATTWGLVSVFGVIVGLALGAGTLDFSTINNLNDLGNQVSNADLWVAFYSLAVGFVVCAGGGLLGGIIPKAVEYPAVEMQEAYPRERETEVLETETETAGRHRG